MTECLPYLSAACREPFRRAELKIFAFSTIVSELKGHDLTKAPVRNTWVTDSSVLEHATSIPAKRRPKLILIATDGYVGPARSNLIAQAGPHPSGGCPDSTPATPGTCNHGSAKSSNFRNYESAC